MTPDELEAYKKEFVRPFDLEKGPCVRFEIIKTDKLTLLADTHHLVSDGASVDLLITQLSSVLDGAAVERENYTYYDFVRDEEITPETEQFFEHQMAEVEEPTQLIPDVFVQNLPHIQKSVFAQTDIQAVKAFAQKNGIRLLLFISVHASSPSVASYARTRCLSLPCQTEGVISRYGTPWECSLIRSRS